MQDLLQRPRRLRRTENLRALVRETILTPNDFILPFFVCAGEKVRKEISSMPNVYNFSVDEVVKEAEKAFAEGVKSCILFGLPESKDESGSGAYIDDGIVQQATQAIKKELPEMIVVADTCLCEYTSHGHCGQIENGEVLNDETLELLAQTAVSQAESGADFLMVKPATCYLDLLFALRQRYDLPLAAYHVSGEYAMIKAAAQHGWIDEKRVMLETLTSIKRAGADLIITYFALDAVRALKVSS